MFSTTSGWEIVFAPPEIVTFVTIVTLIFRSFLGDGSCHICHADFQFSGKLMESVAEGNCRLSPLWSRGLWPCGVRLRWLYFPLRAWGALRCCVPLFPRPALVRVLSRVFSVAGWRCCLALRFSVACPLDTGLCCA